MKLFKSLLWAAAPILCLPLVGCGDAYNVSEVEGVLKLNGQPGNNVLIQFIPDAGRGTKGPMSIAETDIDGKFTLELREKNGTPLGMGAVVGWHRVTLSDQQLAGSATGQGVPIRLSPDLSLPGSTPLMHEVKKGKQEIELFVP
jgi:hypothetical protein